MKRILSLTALLLVMAQTFAQTDDASKYASVITQAELQKQLTIIASDEMEGRETGTEGQRKAAAYIESQFKALSLKIPAGMSSYQQFYPLYKDSMLSSNLVIADYTAKYGDDYIIPRTNVSGKFNTNEIVFAGYGIEDKNYNDYANLNVKGKLVIFILGEPKVDGVYLVTGTNNSSDWSFPGLAKKLHWQLKKEP